MNYDYRIRMKRLTGRRHRLNLTVNINPNQRGRILMWGVIKVVRIFGGATRNYFGFLDDNALAYRTLGVRNAIEEK